MENIETKLVFVDGNVVELKWEIGLLCNGESFFLGFDEVCGISIIAEICFRNNIEFKFKKLGADYVLEFENISYDNFIDKIKDSFHE